MDEEAYSAAEIWQSENGDYADRLFDAAESSSLFAGAEMRSKTHELIIYAVGGPDDVTAAVIRQAPSDVRVIWKSAPTRKGN